jgi:hypothetical protein
MHGNAFCSKTLGVDSHLHHIWCISSARVSQGGDLIDVYTELCHDDFLFLPDVQIYKEFSARYLKESQYADTRFNI